MKRRNNKKISDYMMILAGLVLTAGGLALLKLVGDPQGVMLSLPYICIGLGCGIFGHGMGNCIGRRALKKDPLLQKQIQIEQEDERNRAITDRAKGMAYDRMLFLFGALLISFALMGVELIALLLLVFAYLSVVVFEIYYRLKLEKEM